MSTPVTISGSAFRPSQGDGEVLFGTVPATVTSCSDDTIVVTVPDLLPGSYDVVVSTTAGESEPESFAVMLPRAVFVADDVSSVFGFLVDGDGLLTPVAGSPYDTGGVSSGFGGDSDSLRIHPGTRRAFATNGRASPCGTWTP